MIELLIPFAIAFAAILTDICSTKKRLAALIFAVLLSIVCVFQFAIGDSRTVVVMGRTIGTTPLTALVISISTGLLSMIAWHSALNKDGSPQKLGVLGVSLALLIAALIMKNVVIASLLFGSALIVTALIPSEEEVASRKRILPIAVLSLATLIFSAQAIDRGSANSILFTSQNVAVIMNVALLLLFGAFPFQVWLAPIIRKANPFQLAMLGGIIPLGAITLFATWRLDASLTLSTSAQSLLTVIGIAGCIAGALLSFVRKELSWILCGAALADTSVIIAGIAQGTEQALVAAIAQSIFHAIALSGAALVISRTPGPLSRWRLAIFGITIASLCGIPGTAGFASQLLIVRNIAANSQLFAILILATSFIPFAATLRWILSTESSRSEDSRAGMIIASIMSAVLLVLGVVPVLISTPLGWLLEQLTAAGL